MTNSVPGAVSHTEESCAAFLTFLATQRRASALTIQAYEQDLQKLTELASGRAWDTLLAQDIRHFMVKLHSSGLSARSIARTLSAWRSFYRWLVLQKGFTLNPVEGIRPPKSSKPLPKALSPDQSQALLNHEPEPETLEIRDRAMFELLYSSGLRVAELAGLNLSGSIDFTQGEATVLGKRSKTRIVPVGEPALLATQSWLNVRGEYADSAEEALFVSTQGTRMTTSAIRARLTRWARKYGIGVHVHPHMLRHSFASHVLQSSGDLRAVQEMLGHASIASTQVYTHLDFQHLAKIYDAAHPRAKKQPK